MLSVAVVVQLVAAGLDVQGNSTCPAPEQVAARLHELLPTSSEGKLDAAVDRTPDTVQVTLRSEGTLVGEGRLPLSATCDELASASAVMIAAWRGQLAAPSTAPALSRKVVQVRAAAPTETNRRGVGYQLRVAPALFFGDQQAAPGASVSGRLGFLGSSWTAGLGALVQLPMSIQVGSGFGEWNRFSFHAGPRWTSNSGFAQLELAADGAGALLLYRGRGFDSNLRGSAYQLGFGGSATVSYRAWALRPLISIGALYWPGEQRLRMGNQNASAVLPSLEPRVALGAEWGSR
jgi:hypothetical protein